MGIPVAASVSEWKHSDVLIHSFTLAVTLTAPNRQPAPSGYS
jgi:hypothetical protein